MYLAADSYRLEDAALRPPQLGIVPIEAIACGSWRATRRANCDLLNVREPSPDLKLGGGTH
jgi:hypothetical protein